MFKFINIKKKSYITLILVFTMLATLATGCTSNEETGGTNKEPSQETVQPSTKKIIDSVGREVEIPTKIEKVVTVGWVKGIR